MSRRAEKRQIWRKEFDIRNKKECLGSVKRTIKETIKQKIYRNNFSGEQRK